MGKQDGRGRQVTTGPVDDSATTILHVDMDAFFASVELLDHPELVGKAVIVGHRSSRSIVTAATYEARKFGVNSALPMSIALRRCPHAIVLEPHFERYQHYSAQVMNIFDEITPRVERLGIDEAFLDVAGARQVFGSPVAVAELIRARVRAETGLVCSVGAASTKFVAKLASGLAKPDGVLIVPDADTVGLLHPLPISKLWGVGGKTEELLRARGYHLIADVAAAPQDALRAAVGDAAAERLHELAWGRDPRSVEARPDEKSVGHEMTFETDVTDPVVIRRELLRMANLVAVRLRAAGFEGRTVVLKLRYADFTTITRSHTLPEATDLGRRIYEEVAAIYESTSSESTISGSTGSSVPGKGRRVVTDDRLGAAAIRLVGVRMEQLVSRGGQQALWDDSGGWREAEDVMDAATAKFGRGAVTPARLLGHRGPARPQTGQRD